MVDTSGAAHYRSELPKLVEYLEGFCAASGYQEPWPGLIRSYLAALRAKPFVIFMGLSGTGKTFLAELIAKAAGAIPWHGEAEAGRGYYLTLPVRPDWTDDRGILGFFNPLRESYERTDFLDFILAAHQAWKDAGLAGELAPLFFVCLDEMNLARVEHYFAAFLSGMETRERTLNLGASGEQLEKSGIPRELVIPPNLLFTGTINVDETTYGLAPKVLDRSNAFRFDCLELGADPPSAGGGSPDAEEFFVDLFRRFFLDEEVCQVDRWRSWVANDVVGAPWKRVVVERLQPVHDVLQRGRLHFGFRVRDEVLRFLAVTADLGFGEEATRLDFALEQKVLTRLRGDQARLQQVLEGLEGLFGEWAAEAPPFLVPRAREVVRRLKQQLESGYAAAVE